MFTLKNIILSLIVFIAFTNFLWAQPPGGLNEEEVEVIKEFEARLIDSEKLLLNPSLPPLDTTTKRLIYNVPTKTISVDYLAPKIRPLAMKRKALPPNYNGYLKLGYGFPSSPYGEFLYKRGKDKKYDYGVRLKHHSASYNKDFDNQRFMENDFGIYGSYYTGQGIGISGNVDYKMDQIHYFGYDDMFVTLDREQIKQQFNTFSFGAKAFNAERTAADFDYSAAVDFYSMKDNFASKETGTLLKFKIAKWFADKHPLSVVLGTDFTRFQDTAVQKLNNFYLKPSFTYHADLFKVQVGVNVVNHDDEYNIFPLIEASANIIGNQLAAFAGWKGDLQKNTFRSLTDYNPYLNTRTILSNTRYNHFYGGVKGNISSINYQIQAGYKKADDLALFQTNYLNDLRSLDVVYDTVNIFSIEGTISARPISNLEITATLASNVYDPKNEEKAWHLPVFETNISASYLMLEDKLKVKGELFVENGVPYLTENNVADNLNSLFDVNIGAEYTITNNIGVFLDINNIAGNKRQRWNNFPTYGLNLLGGVTARF